jgi:hypothetical protein
VSRGDDEDTDRLRRPRSHRGDDQGASISSASRRRAPQSHPRGVPLVGSDDPDPDGLADVERDTSEFEILDAPLTEAEVEIIRRSRRDSGDNATFADVVRIVRRLASVRREERSNNKTRTNQLLELLDRPPGGNIKAAKGLWGVAGTALTLALAAALWLAHQLWVGGAFEDMVRLKFEQQGHDIEQCHQDIRDQRASRRAPLPAPDRASWPQTPAPKDTAP